MVLYHLSFMFLGLSFIVYSFFYSSSLELLGIGLILVWLSVCGMKWDRPTKDDGKHFNNTRKSKNHLK